jgi:putative hydrolase
MASPYPINQAVTAKLLEIADLLEVQGANPFRVIAYRRAATTIRDLDQALEQLVEQKGFDGLLELPGIGEGIARSIYEYVAMGHMSRLDGMQAKQDPVVLFEKIPGVGPVLARAICEHLHVQTLEGLEQAAYNGRLAKVPGMGKGRVQLIQAWLANTLGRRRPQLASTNANIEPSVALLLDIDRLYREQAGLDKLPKIAPKRFNPDAQAWLPILHTTRGDWHFTAMYSNTPRAHQLGHTRDWVVIYCYNDQHVETQNTVVDETHGVLTGKRVVRGREPECREFYASSKNQSAAP